MLSNYRVGYIKTGWVKISGKWEYGAEEVDCKTQDQYVLVMSLQNKLV